VLGEDVSGVEPQTLDQDDTTLTITTYGNTERKISLGVTNGSLFTVGGTFVTPPPTTTPRNAKFVIDGHITLQGKTDNNASLVQVKFGGSLDLKGYAKLTGNTTTNGGAILISGGSGTGEDATVTMSGNAEISGNKSTSAIVGGGGVALQSYAAFTMSGNAAIKNNTAFNGGGVYTVGGLVIMNGGVISGNIVIGTGGGVHIQSGTFTVANEQVLAGIRDNTAGGAGTHVYVYSPNNPTFTVGGEDRGSF
jgi:hypothetical protein